MKNLFETTRTENLEPTINVGCDPVAFGREFKKLVKSVLPFVKLSIVKRYYDRLSIDIVSTPFPILSVEFEAVVKFIETLAEINLSKNGLFKYHCVEIDYDYSTINGYPVEEISSEFKKNLKEFEDAEEIRLDAEYQERSRIREIEHQEFLKQKALDDVSIANIEKNVKVFECIDITDPKCPGVELVENVKFASLNKNQTLSKYIEQVEDGEFETNTICIDRIVDFENSEDFEFFKKHLLTDFSFLDGQGGCYTEDPRVNSMEDWSRLPKEIRNTIKWITSVVLIKFKGTVQFVVDPQGYSYARYVGIF